MVLVMVSVFIRIEQFILNLNHLLHPTLASYSLITPDIYSGPLHFPPARFLGSSKTGPSSVVPCYSPDQACSFPMSCFYLDLQNVSALKSSVFSVNISAFFFFFVVLQGSFSSAKVFDTSKQQSKHLKKYIYLLTYDINLMNVSENTDFLYLIFQHKLLNLNWDRAFDGWSKPIML